MIRVKSSARTTDYKRADSFDDGAAPSGPPPHTVVAGLQMFGRAELLSTFKETEYGS
jgi:hypothetical protein